VLIKNKGVRPLFKLEVNTMFGKIKNIAWLQHRINKQKHIKKTILPIKTRIKNYKFKFKFMELIKWVLIDIYRKIKYPTKIHLYGVRCVVGMYGMGKTMVMSKIALDYREKYGENILICSNYGLAIQDFPFTDIKQVAVNYTKPIIFLWDEVQNDFPSTDKVFPKEIRQALSLNRKGHGKMYYWASQDHELVHKTIRRLTIQYGQVKTLFHRYTRVRWYQSLDFQALTEKLDVSKRMKIHPVKRDSFIQTDYIRSLYNSFGVDNGEKLLKS